MGAPHAVAACKKLVVTSDGTSTPTPAELAAEQLTATAAAWQDADGVPIAVAAAMSGMVTIHDERFATRCGVSPMCRSDSPPMSREPALVLVAGSDPSQSIGVVLAVSPAGRSFLLAVGCVATTLLVCLGGFRVSFGRGGVRLSM